MTYPPLRQQRLADVITERLEAMILEGSLKPGQRLPQKESLLNGLACRAPLYVRPFKSLPHEACLPAAKGVVPS